MADVMSTTTTLNNLLATYFVRKALPRLVQKSVLYQFSDKQPLPKGEGKTVQFNAWSNMAAASAVISEGNSPSLAAISSRKVTCTLAQYGRGVKLTDLVTYTASLDCYQGAIDVLSDCAAHTVENAIQLALFKSTIGTNTGTSAILSSWMSCTASGFHAGSNASLSTLAWGFPVVFGTTATTLSAVSKTAPSVSARMSLYAIRKAVKQLRGKSAMEFADGYYKMVSNSDAIQDLYADPDFKQWYQYTTPEPMETAAGSKYEMKVEGCKVYQSNYMPKYRVTAHSCDVSFIFGQGAYGSVNITGGKGFEIIVKRPNDSDTSNPFNLFGTVAFKVTMAAAALNVSSGRTLITHAKP